MRGDHLHERAVACDRYPGRAGVQVLDLPPVAVLVEQSGQLARAGGSGSVLALAHVMLRPAEISSDPPSACSLVTACMAARRVSAPSADVNYARGLGLRRCASAL